MVPHATSPLMAMASATPAQGPTLLLLPGAFTSPSCYDRLRPYLHRAGYPTVVPTLPSSIPLQPESGHYSVANDVRFIRNEILLPLIEGEGKTVVIFAHSYGAQASGAAEGLNAKLRAKRGLSGGVAGLVLLAGNIVPEGLNFLQLMGGKWPSYIRTDHPSPGLAIMQPVTPTLLNDADAALAPSLRANVSPHAMSAFTTPTPPQAWAEPAFDKCKAYIRTLRDAVHSPALQDTMLDNSSVKWQIVDIDAGHCAYLTKAEDVANLIVMFARRWAG